MSDITQDEAKMVDLGRCAMRMKRAERKVYDWMKEQSNMRRYDQSPYWPSYETAKTEFFQTLAGCE